MDTPENYYAILGVPIDADNDTLKRAYRQLARRYHPDLAGPEGAVEMKRINRAYAVLSDAEKRQNYDAVIGGVIDLRHSGFVRPRPRPHNPAEDAEFTGLSIFCTRGPLKRGTSITSSLGVISALSCIRTVQGLLVAAGSLDGKGSLWQVVNAQASKPINFEANPAFTTEALRGMRLSAAGSLLAGWNRLHLHVWDAYSGALLWSYAVDQRAVSTHYSLDMALQAEANGQRLAHLALPLLMDNVPAPRAWGVRGTDITSHEMGMPETAITAPVVCIEEEIEKRQFWAIRLRALSQDACTLLTLSCAHVSHEQQEVSIARKWNLAARTRTGKSRPQIDSSLLVGPCIDCAPPYAVTPDARVLAFVHARDKLRICDTGSGSYSELASGVMGSSAKLALSADAEWAAIAREDSELNEGVIDLWSVSTGQVVQKLYHPWQISALHFVEKQLVVALTDGTIHIWE
ncbi:hypothetical protein EPA93_37310 [Ktedonosporobacter rubrisoli]|uniref:J domain-containing protein n=1 Tax=Ktedonosporobacter rubrisoli TaxID=2509675 RepID=A0A4P6K0K3_KTERU|nr:DnaJ domain-containing protein [Ktedonosporobacter rubrisoli]QBD81333.1 hypothetical protein EPA93_37310 [Ktedonosporobacter rubrisoli]